MINVYIEEYDNECNEVAKQVIPCKNIREVFKAFSNAEIKDFFLTKIDEPTEYGIATDDEGGQIITYLKIAEDSTEHWKKSKLKEALDSYIKFIEFFLD